MRHRNLAALHRAQALRLGPRIALRHKKHGLYHDISWSVYHDQVQAGAAALVAAGIEPGDRVGLLAENRAEWLIADMAILAAGAVNVPPHAPLTARQVSFQFRETGIRWLFVSTVAQFEKIKTLLVELPDLQGIVIFDASPMTLEETSSPSPGQRVLSWDGFLQRGRRALDRLGAELEQRADQLGPHDLATIMYTSGTTGDPKGVMLTHGNLLSNAVSTNEASPRAEGAVVLCWLPFSHIYARTVDHYLSIVAAVPLCLAESAETLVANLAEIQPTHFCSVPRFYEKVLALVGGGGAVDSGRRLRGIFGARLQWLSSGGAPLAPAIAKAYEEAGLLLLQGYGLTESAPVISFNRPTSYKLETVGQAIPGVDITIADDGEVLTRGPHVMKGYWQNAPATAEAIRSGWLHTGDLGRLDQDGFLTISGRKKELLVLSSGKKVVPPYIEGLLVGDACIDQAVIYGEGKNFLTALIVPNWPNMRTALAASGFTEIALGLSSLSCHPAVCALLEQRIQTALAEVSPWERVKRFKIVAEAFSVAAEELTVSLKLRRQVVLARHQEALDRLYRDG